MQTALFAVASAAVPTLDGRGLLFLGAALAVSALIELKVKA
jgi:hypothetical protein